MTILAQIKKSQKWLMNMNECGGMWMRYAVENDLKICDVIGP
jgi:hypothetical protein